MGQGEPRPLSTDQEAATSGVVVDVVVVDGRSFDVLVLSGEHRVGLEFELVRLQLSLHHLEVMMEVMTMLLLLMMMM